MLNKRAKFAFLWIYVGFFFFLVAIAMIEPLKGPTQDSMDRLNCSTTDDEFIKPVCFLEKGVVVLFVGGFLLALGRWIYVKSIER